MSMLTSVLDQHAPPLTSVSHKTGPRPKQRKVLFEPTQPLDRDEPQHGHGKLHTRNKGSHFPILPPTRLLARNNVHYKRSHGASACAPCSKQRKVLFEFSTCSPLAQHLARNSNIRAMSGRKPQHVLYARNKGRYYSSSPPAQHLAQNSNIRAVRGREPQHVLRTRNKGRQYSSSPPTQPLARNSIPSMRVRATNRWHREPLLETKDVILSMSVTRKTPI